MNKSKINPEDINLLSQVLNLPNELIIYDPKGFIKESKLYVVSDVTALLQEANAYKVCVNLSDQNLEVLSFDFILEFNNSKRTYRAFERTPFLAINNPDQTIRWFLPEESKFPNFLELYNGSGIKAAGFNFATRLAFQLNLKKWICRGGFCLYSREANYFVNRFESKELAVFTGTVGENRKAVAAICRKGKATHFIKIPISKNAERLIQTEEQHLEELSKYDFEKLNLPSVESGDVGLKITNIRPPESFSSVSINEQHLQALKDLYANTFKVKVLENLDVFSRVKKDLYEIKNTSIEYNKNLSSRKVERLAYNINVLLSTFETQQPVPVAYAHGDFTPWNMFLSEKRVHSYDWELAMPEQLFLYDAFHFVFQSSILILHQSFESISIKIKQLEQDPTVVDLVERFRLDYWACYRWYLISNCSYYLNLYMKQKNLHKQALWLIDCWIDATNDAIKQNNAKVVHFA